MLRISNRWLRGVYVGTFRRTLKVQSIDNSNFTHDGIVPFIQYRINKYFGEKFSNVSPTSDQKRILSILHDNKSLVMTSNVQSGKSFSLLLYTINKALTKVPSSHGSIQSIIVVPNNTLLLKYRAWTESLIEEIEPECCPVQEEGVVSRVPLGIQLIDSRRLSVLLSTNKQEPHKPQILILNSKVFYDILEGVHKGNAPKRDELVDCSFVAVDEADFLISGSSASASPSTNMNVRKTAAKGKFILRLQEALRSLRQLKINTGKIIPIQYSFIFHSKHPFHSQFLLACSKDTAESHISAVEKLVRLNDEELDVFKKQPTLASLGGFENKHFYGRDELGQPVKRINLALVETRNLTKERRVVSILQLDPLKNLPAREEFPVYFKQIGSVIYKNQLNNSFKQYLKASMSFQRKKQEVKSYKFSIFRQLKETVRHFRKIHPSNKEPILIIMPQYTEFGGVIKLFNADPENSESGEVLVGYPQVKSLLSNNELFYYNEKKEQENLPFGIDDFFSSQPGNQTYNLVYPSDELPGMSFSGVKNMILFGDVNFPQFATASWLPENANMITDNISGTWSPHNDLFHYYLLKLQMDQDFEERNILIALSSYGRKPTFNGKALQHAHKSRLKEMILYSDISSLVKYTEHDPEKKIEELDYSDLTLF